MEGLEGGAYPTPSQTPIQRHQATTIELWGKKRGESEGRGGRRRDGRDRAKKGVRSAVKANWECIETIERLCREGVGEG